MKRKKRTDQDSPWKQALHLFLSPFLAFFFPKIHEAVDWSRGYESLDKELHKIARNARTGGRFADKLFKVWRKNGKEAWLLIHVEIQGRREKRFAKRMFTYWYRIFDLYQRPVVSLAVLCDDNMGWKPEKFGYNVLGCKVGMKFLVAKILEYRGREELLELDQNPFAAIVLAQLKAIETRRTPSVRQTWKLRLIKGLYQRGLKAEEMRQLFRLIDWLLVLPDDLDEAFDRDIYQFEQEQKMPYLSGIERRAIKKGHKIGKQEGLRDGLLEGIAFLLEAKFGEVDKRLMDEIEALEDVGQLRKVGRALKKAKTPDDIHRLTGK